MPDRKKPAAKGQTTGAKPKSKPALNPKIASLKAVASPITKKKAPRKPRKPIAWDRWLWAAAAVNIAVGLLYSPVTSLRSVRVTGAFREDENRIAEALQSAKGKPFAQISDAGITGSLYNMEKVASVEISRNIFGRAVLKISTPVVIARVEGYDNLALIQNGELRTGLPFPKNAPSVSLAESFLSPMPAMVSLLPASEIAALVEKTRQKWPNQDWMVHVDEGGVLSLRKDKGPVVVLGVVHKIDEKIVALEQLLDSQPDLVKKRVRITLTEPSAPAIAPLVFERS